MQSGELEVTEMDQLRPGLPTASRRNGHSVHAHPQHARHRHLHYSAAKTIRCPFTNKKLAALPALYPDVAVIHVHESDPHGNCRMKGIAVADLELSRASKKVIITAERIISNDEIRQCPEATLIPSLCVDAVCHVPCGSYPGNMPGEYFSDEKHLTPMVNRRERRGPTGALPR